MYIYFITLRARLCYILYITTFLAKTNGKSSFVNLITLALTCQATILIFFSWSDRLCCARWGITKELHLGFQDFYFM